MSRFQCLVQEDDVMLWRMIAFALVSEITAGTGRPSSIRLGLEQPATPNYMRETVPLCRTKEWLITGGRKRHSGKAISLLEIEVPMKSTTWAGSLDGGKRRVK